MSFIHKFTFNDRYFIYDVNTNKIFEVDEIIYTISSYFNLLSLEEIKEKYANKFSLRQIEIAWNTLQIRHQENGHLLDIRINNRGQSFDWDGIEPAIKSEVRHMVLNVTDDCNLRCSYCIYSGDFDGRRTYSKKLMSKEVAKKALDYFLEHSSNIKGFMAVGFYGGEPLLNFDLIKWSIEYLSEKYKRDIPLIYTLTTNGTVFNQEIIDFLIRNNVMLFISLDGPQEIQDMNRRSIGEKGTFDIIAKNLEQIKNTSLAYYKSNIRLSSVLTGGSDYLELDRFFAEHGLPVRVSSLESYAVDKLQHLNPFINRIGNFDKMREKFIEVSVDNRFNRKETDSELLLVKNLFENTMRRIHRRYPTRDLIQDPPGHSICMPGANRIFVSTTGDYFICEKVEGNSNMKVGNVDSGVDVSIVKTMIKDYYDFINEECSNCWLVRMCSACFVHAVHNNQFDKGKFKQNCQLRKRVFNDALITYVEIATQNPDAFDWLERDELDDLLEQ